MDNVVLFSIKLGKVFWRKRNTDCQQTALSLMQKIGAICQNLGWFGLSDKGILQLISSEQPPICALTQMEQDAGLCHWESAFPAPLCSSRAWGVGRQSSHHLSAPIKMRMGPTEQIIKTNFIQRDLQIFFFPF